MRHLTVVVSNSLRINRKCIHQVGGAACWQTVLSPLFTGYLLLRIGFRTVNFERVSCIDLFSTSAMANLDVK